MRYWIFLFIWFGMIGPAFGRFLSPTTDIPLMEGMTPLGDDDNFNFDTPAGQIQTIITTTSKSPESVRRFYQKTLPALGWVQQENDVFTRDGDELILTIDTTVDGVTTVSFGMTLTGS